MKYIFFDWSGVVKDSVNTHLWIVNEIFKKCKVNEISLSELRQGWKQPYMDFYNRYVPNLSLAEEQKLYKEFGLSPNCPKSKAYPGITDFIKILKQDGNYLVVVSSDMPATLLPEIKSYGLENVFDEVLTNVIDKTKAVGDLLKKYKTDLRNAYFVGDSNQETESGKALGIKTVAITWGFTTEAELKKLNPDFMVSSLQELRKVFNE